LKILFDGIFNQKPKSGVHRYFFNLIKNLPAGIQKFSSSTITNTNILNHHIPYFRHFRPHRVSFLLEYLWFKKQCLRGEFDLIHSAFYNLSDACQALIKKGIPHIITVHDLTHEIYDNKGKADKIRNEILENTKAIISVSNNTKEDLLDIYPSINEKKVFVVHHGKENHNHTDNRKKFIKEKFLLFVGHREGYKNFKSIFPSLKVLNKLYGIKLFVVGPESTKDEKDLIDKNHLTSTIQFLGQVSDKTLDILYTDCIALVYTSLYEGFGLPLIESMSNGAIPIAMKTSAMPEVLENAGILVQPNCHESITRSIKRIIEDEKYRNSLINKSIKRAKAFCWKKSAEKTLSIYKKINQI
jgi:glycosyltransferase involved in cell wall biosynthesis